MTDCSVLVAVVDVAISQLKPQGVVGDILKKIRRSSTLQMDSQLQTYTQRGSFDASALLAQYTELRLGLMAKLEEFKLEEGDVEEQKTSGGCCGGSDAVVAPTDTKK